MTTIGYATLQIIPSLRGVTEAIEQQIDGKVVDISIKPKVDQRAAEDAGKKTRETVEKQTAEIKVAPKVDPKAADTAGRTAREGVEKHTRDVKVEPKVDQKAAEQAGKTTGEAVTRGASGSSTGIGQAIIGALEGAGGEAGRRLGERLSDGIPNGLTGAADRIGTALRNSLPTLGASAGTMLGTAIGIGLTDAIGAERLDKAGRAVMSGLSTAVGKANVGADIGIAVGNTIAGGLTNASGVVGNAAVAITDTIGGIGSALTTTKGLLGGDDSWAAPGLDTLNNALGTATPLLEGMTAASTLASAGAQAISVATGVASKAQALWNAALIANPIGLIVAAIAAVVAGLVLFFTKTELGQKIWKGFTDFMGEAWEKVKLAFAVAWEAIKVVWDAMVNKAGEVWQGIKDRFTAVVDFVKGLPGKIGAAAKGMWDGIGNAFKSMVNGLISAWNWFADKISFTIPDIPGMPNRGEKFNPVPTIQSLDGGGFTGNMPIDQIAGVVHGGEHVIQATSRRSIENAFPGLLDYMNATGRMPGYEGGGLVAGTAELRKIIQERFGISNIGGYRGADGYNEHSTGRALDVMVGNNKAKGDSVKDFAIANASAIDLKWAIWQQRLWNPDGSSKPMEDRGSPTQNHMDHVHIFSGPGIANGLLGSLKSKESEAAAQPDVTGATATTPQAAPVTQSSGSSVSEGVSVPSSISGLSTFGLDSLGVTTATQIGDRSQERTLDIGNAASAAVGGQVSSALGVLGVGDSPGWLQGISKFVGGISVSDSSGKKIFGGGAAGNALGGTGSLFGNTGQTTDGYGGAAPVAASAPVGAAPVPGGAVHGSTGGQQPGPAGPTYHIRTATVEDAFLQAQRQEDVRLAAKIDRWN